MHIAPNLSLAAVEGRITQSAAIIRLLLVKIYVLNFSGLPA